MRRVSVIGGALLLLTLSGCTVPEVGDLAYGRDEAGNLLAVVQMCKGAVDNLTVYNSAHGYDQVWSFSTPVTDFGTVAMTGLNSDLPSGAAYSAFAGSHDNTAQARGPDFHIVNLKSILPGQVFALKHANDSKGTVMTVDQFREMVKSQCD
jgi:hypothetical protein